MAKNRSLTQGLLACGAGVALAGCATSLPPVVGGAHLEEVAVSVEPPGQVAILIAAEASRQPLTQVRATSFQIHENGVRLDPATTGQTLLPASTVTSFHTLLMVDASGPLTPEDRARLVRGVTSFVSALSAEQGVTVYAFDGSPTPTLIADFVAGSPPSADSLEPLARLEPRDTSRDLRGALLSGLQELNARMMHGRKPLRVGTLVVLARGGDLARRVSDDRYYGSIDATQREVFVAVVGEATPELRRLGKSGYVEVPTLADVGQALEQAAGRARGVVAKHHLLSYCSPARSGMADARVELRSVDASGRERVGRFALQYDATAFGAGCDPQRPPSFGLPRDLSTPGASGGTATPATSSQPGAAVPEPSPAPAPTSSTPGGV